jgi:hypothetical protein
MPPLQGTAQGQNAVAVEGISTGPSALAGVRGTNDSGSGVIGESKGTDPNQRGFGVLGQAIGAAVVGESQTWMGVVGFSQSTTGGAGVMGHAVGGGAGAFGLSAGPGAGPGVHGKSEGTDPNKAGFGVFGQAVGAGVVGESQTWMGVFGKSESTTGGAGVMGEHAGDGLAGFFKGHVQVTRDLTVEGDVKLAGADVAEEFDVVGDVPAEPGCVVVLAGEDGVRVCDEAYDRRVAGVVSGAGDHRPGLVLDQQDDAERRPLALTGKVWCKVDADHASVEVGDLLTTSSTPGYAMRVTDPARAFGAVIGKALGSLESGRALVPVLVALH